MTVAAFHAAGQAMRNIQSMAWPPGNHPSCTTPPIHAPIFSRYEIMGAMGPSAIRSPDFDPNKVEGTPEELITTRVDIRDFLRHKMRALRCHRTQIAPDWWLTRVPHEVLRDKFGLECFTRVVSHVAVDGPEDDLFAGLR